MDPVIALSPLFSKYEFAFALRGTSDFPGQRLRDGAFFVPMCAIQNSNLLYSRNHCTEIGGHMTTFRNHHASSNKVVQAILLVLVCGGFLAGLKSAQGQIRIQNPFVKKNENRTRVVQDLPALPIGRRLRNEDNQLQKLRDIIPAAAATTTPLPAPEVRFFPNGPNSRLVASPTEIERQPQTDPSQLPVMPPNSQPIATPPAQLAGASNTTNQPETSTTIVSEPITPGDRSPALVLHPDNFPSPNTVSEISTESREQLPQPPTDNRQQSVLNLPTAPTTLQRPTLQLPTLQGSFGGSSAQYLPVLFLDIQGPSKLRPAESAIFEIIVANRGAAAAENVTLVLPASQAYEIGKVAIGNQLFASSFESSEFDSRGIPLDTLAPGEDRTVVVELQPARGGKLELEAELSLMAKVKKTVSVAQPEIGLEIIVPQSARPGQACEVGVLLRNSGDSVLESATLQLASNPNIRIEQPSTEIQNLAPGESKQLQFNAIISSEFAALGNQNCEIKAELYGSGIHKKVAQALQIHVPRLKLSLSCNALNNQPVIGQETTFALRVNNATSDVAKDIEVTLDFPATVSVKVLDRVATIDRENNRFIYRLKALAPGEEETILVSAVPVQSGNHKPQAFAFLADKPAAVSKN